MPVIRNPLVPDSDSLRPLLHSYPIVWTDYGASRVRHAVISSLPSDRPERRSSATVLAFRSGSGPILSIWNARGMLVWIREICSMLYPVSSYPRPHSERATGPLAAPEWGSGLTSPAGKAFWRTSKSMKFYENN